MSLDQLLKAVDEHSSSGSDIEVSGTTMQSKKTLSILLREDRGIKGSLESQFGSFQLPGCSRLYTTSDETMQYCEGLTLYDDANVTQWPHIVVLWQEEAL